MNETVTYKLKHPIRHTKNDVITEIVVRRLKVKDIRVLEGRDFSSVEAVRLLTGLDSVVLDEMDGEDFIKVSELVAGFLPSAPQTGGSASGSWRRNSGFRPWTSRR
jgi:hypothetical protein